MDARNLEARQRAVCERYGSIFVASPANLKVGISKYAKQDLTAFPRLVSWVALLESRRLR
ncbi:MAG: hypothetical protein ABW200_03700 [Hyphomicrobiaceae bacterium]